MSAQANPQNNRFRRLLPTPLAPLGVLLVAAAARFWRLDYHSFWFDEAVTLGWARAGAAYTWDVTFRLAEEKHPPAYYLALHYWQTALGWLGWAESDPALRAFGALLGVLTVWGILRAATRLGGPATGLLAGLLSALAPALVWYSQELRMFQPAATGLVWAVAFLLAAHRQKSPVRVLLWLGFCAGLLFALYSYLFAGFFLPGLGLSLLLLARRPGRFRWRFFWEGSAALAIVAALFLPLAGNAWGINRAESPPGVPFADFLPNLWRQVRIFSVWQPDWPPAFVAPVVGLFAALALAGLLLPGPPRTDFRPDARPLLVLWIGGPLLVGNLLLATNAGVFREDRYFLFLAPFLLWAVARGVVSIGRWRAPAGVGAGGAAVGLLLAALPVLWTPGLYRENWRAAAQYIAAYQQRSPGLSAAAVAHPDYLHRPLEWYLRRDYSFEELPVYGLFGGPLTPDQTETVIAPPLRGIETSLAADTLWLAQSHLPGVDDQRLVQAWLDANYPLITEQFPAGVELRGYAVRYRYPALPPLAEEAVYPAAQIAPGVALAACEVTTPDVPAQDAVYHPPSGWVHLRLWLRADRPPREPLALSARVVDATGAVWGRALERPGDVLAFYPASRWQPGEFVRVELDVNLNRATPPGEYALRIDGPTGEFSCGTVQITR